MTNVVAKKKKKNNSKSLRNDGNIKTEVNIFFKITGITLVFYTNFS